MANALLSWQQVIAACAPCFTVPSFQLWQGLIQGWILCPGRRTVTRVITMGDPLHQHAHDAYHRFLRAGKWSMAQLWKYLAEALVGTLCKEGDMLLDVDDTLFHKTGRKVEGAGIFRDAVRSTLHKVVYARGLNLVVITLRITPPWKGVPLGLPINMRLHKKEDATYIELAAEMIKEITAWFPTRQFRLNGDGAYAAMAGTPLTRTVFTSRMRRDAAIYQMPPKVKKKARGRPRKKGQRLPSPQTIAQQTKEWEKTPVNIRGKTVTRLLRTQIVLWYKVAPERPVLLVIVRDPEGKEPDDFFFTTDIQAPPEQVASDYAARWSIEDTFRDVKQFLRGQDPQCWKGKGPQRAAALSLWLYSAVWMWYIKTHGSKPRWPIMPWYKGKSTPAFIEAIAQLRRDLWRREIFAMSEIDPHHEKITHALIEALARAA
jgi:hypothetical protein|tara:strand:- start:65 stop:1357 length:1293 start_codon:yes stop_codon:yes gene_type:complete